MRKISVALLVVQGMANPSAWAKVQATVRSVKDATHFEFSGNSDWRYEVHRDSSKGKYRAEIQFSGVKADEIRSLATLQDKRLSKIEVREGLNGDALLELTFADSRINVFDYQTENPTNLVFDVFREDEPKKKAAVAKKKTPRDELATLVKRTPKNKFKSRQIASVDAITLGNQPLLTATSPDEKTRLKYGIFDGGDQELKRFRMEEKDIDEAALIRNEEKNIYLNFPELNNNDHPYLKDLLANSTNYEVAKLDTEENQMVRLIIKLFKENKAAVVLRTLKFFREKFPKSEYDQTLASVEADTYYKLWQRDHNPADFESAMTRYKDLLNKYPDLPDKFRLVFFIGLNYLDRGDNFGALSTFQVGIRDYPQSPYYWPMRVAVAEALRELNKDKDAVKEFEAIEKDPRSGNFGVEARFRRGDVYFRAKDYSTAVKEYKEALTRYPTKWAEGPNIYFNSAEAQFRLKNYRDSLNEFRAFLQRFPSHPYGGYAMTRIGSILELLGAPEHKVVGAYLESYFRYRGTPGAYLAKLRVNATRFPAMKPKEVKAVIKEAYDEMPVGKIDNIETFVKLTIADGYQLRKEFDTSLDMLVKYYQDNPISPFLPTVKKRIVQNITSQIEFYGAQKNHMKALEVFLKHSDTWLAKNNRIDTAFFAGQAYEALNLVDDAAALYRKCANEIYASTPEQLKYHKILEKLPSTETLNLRLAKVHFLIDDLKKAGEYLENVKNPETPTETEKVEKSLILAAVAEKEERFDVAIVALKDLTDHWKGQVALLTEPWLRLARIYNQQKKYDQALTWIQKVVNASQDTKNEGLIKLGIVREALDLAGGLYLNSGHPQEAIESYKLLVDKYSDGYPVASYKYKIGKIYFDQNNIKAATKIWSQLKTEKDGLVWSKIADENLAQAQWSDKYKQYVGREPASQPVGGKKK